MFINQADLDIEGLSGLNSTADYSNEDDTELELLLPLEEELDTEQATPEKAASYMKQFFSKKSMHYGGPILDSDLLTARHIDMVLRLDLMICVDIFHDAMNEHGEQPINEKEKEAKFTKSLKLLIKLQEEIGGQLIPRQYCGGLLLVYLILCKGLDI